MSICRHIHSNFYYLFTYFNSKLIKLTVPSTYCTFTSQTKRCKKKTRLHNTLRDKRWSLSQYLFVLPASGEEDVHAGGTNLKD